MDIREPVFIARRLIDRSDRSPAFVGDGASWNSFGNESTDKMDVTFRFSSFVCSSLLFFPIQSSPSRSPSDLSIFVAAAERHSERNATYSLKLDDIIDVNFAIIRIVRKFSNCGKCNESSSFRDF